MSSMSENRCKPTLPEVIPQIDAYYRKPGNGAGGCLHIFLDDGNIRDQDIQFCLELAKSKKDTDAVIISEILMRMSKTQRSRLAGMDWGRLA